jgi:hypothetical protein
VRRLALLALALLPGPLPVLAQLEPIQPQPFTPPVLGKPVGPSLQQLKDEGVIQAQPAPSSEPVPLRPDQNRSSTGPIAPRRFSESLDELVRQGVVTPSPAHAKPLSPKEQQLLDRIRASKQPVDQWRRFGQCSYDWSGWKLHSNGIRTTGVDCGGTAMRWQIGVSCDRLLVSIRSRDGAWGSWEPPAGAENRSRQGEELMVANLCANALAAPAPAPAEVKP